MKFTQSSLETVKELIVYFHSKVLILKHEERGGSDQRNRRKT